MLVELLRGARTLPLDYYKELICSWRRIVYDLSMHEAQDCLALYRHSDLLFDRLQREVMQADLRTDMRQRYLDAHRSISQGESRDRGGRRGRAADA
jgi:hypothetical protein